MTDAHPAPTTTIRIGRVPDNDIALADLDVSRHHAELRRNPDGSVEIIDLGSHGGTYVNGKRITRTMLTDQDIIGIGHATFRLSAGELRQDADESPGSVPALTSAHEVVAAYWAAAEARDWHAVGALLADDVIYRGPQTREQVRGRDRYIRFNVEGFPDDWHLTVRAWVLRRPDQPRVVFRASSAASTSVSSRGPSSGASRCAAARAISSTGSSATSTAPFYAVGDRRRDVAADGLR